MPRDLPVGNGKLLICFDQNYCIREIYFPHVGLENHVSGNFCRMGVWVDGQFSWVGPEWERELRYLPDTLVTDVKLAHARLGVALACHDAVDFHEDIYLREIVVTNISPSPREIRLFFTLDLDINGNELGDTAGYDPKTGAVVHYKGARYFLAGGTAKEGEGLSQFAVGQKDSGGLEGTFKDAEDGLLSGNPIAQGSVDSVISLTLTLPPYESGQAYYWLIAGQNWGEVLRLDSLVKHKHPRGHLKRTEDYWRLWVRKESPELTQLPEPVAELYRRSLLVVRTQVDWQGGILAANDSDVVYFNRDTYSYVWPRDGSLVAYALDQAGHPASTRNFFQFISGLLQPEGCLLHKFNPDGTLASSWHPSMHSDRRFVTNMIKAGAHGYLLKDSAFEELATAIRMVMARKTYLSHEIAHVVVKDYVQGGKDDPSVFSVLSPREREVLQLMAEGKSNRQIAETPNVSLKTIETHRQQIMNKLEIHNIVELTKYAIREGLASLDH